MTRDDAHSRRFVPVPNVGFAREHQRRRAAQVGAENAPRPAHDRVGLVDPDMAAPHDLDAAFGQGGSQGRGLRVVKKRHVAGAHLFEQGRGVGHERLFVHTALGGGQLHAVQGDPVEEHVDLLGDCEEVRRALDGDPTLVHAGRQVVRDQRAEQLRDAAAAAGRVDVPHDPPARPGRELVHRIAERRESAISEQRPVALEGCRDELDLLKGRPGRGHV